MSERAPLALVNTSNYLYVMGRVESKQTFENHTESMRGRFILHAPNLVHVASSVLHAHKDVLLNTKKLILALGAHGRR